MQAISKRPLSKSTLICPICVSGSNFNHRNTLCIPMAKIFAFLDLEKIEHFVNASMVLNFISIPTSIGGVNHEI